MKTDLSPVRGKRVLLALSGGADSVALFMLLLEAGVSVACAHFEHGLRGEASVKDMEFCRALCERKNVPLFAERARVCESRFPGEGMESSARRMRYAFLQRVMDENGFDVLATAHHLDDQAETVLMHLFRGAGLSGTGGMRALSQDGRVFRPLLSVRKKELMEYLTALGETWREDETNREDFTPRNALRNLVMPVVEKHYPGAAEAMGRFAAIQQDADDFILQCAREWREKYACAYPGGTAFPLKNKPHRAVIAQVFLEAGGNALEASHVLALLDLWEGKTDKKLTLPGFWAERAGDFLFFIFPNTKKTPAVPFLTEGRTELNGFVSVFAHPAEPVPSKDPFTQVLSTAALTGAELRFRREGDFIRPLGAGGTKSLSDYLTDKKFLRPVRNCIPLLARGSEVLWAAGVGISETAKVVNGVEATSVSLEFASEKFKTYFFGGTKA